MALYTDATTYGKALLGRFKHAERAGIKGAAKASLFLSTELRITAPVWSKKLRNSVRRRSISKGYSVLAGYSRGNFNVGRYINQEITSKGKIYPGGVLHPTSKTFPWFDTAWNKSVSRYRANYKLVRASLRG